jgi:gamma-glutamyl hydrolase
MKQIQKIFLFVTISIGLAKDVPIIAIVAEPNPDNTGDLIGSYVNEQYVKWLESAAAMTMVIQPWYDFEQIDEILTDVNGVLFPGGDRDLNLTKTYEQNAKHIIQRAIELYDKGKPIPIWGTCQGFQLIHSILMEEVDLKKFDAFNYPNKINILDRNAKVFKYFPEEDLQYSESSYIFPHYNNFGISRSQYKEYPSLNLVFNIVATA